MRKMYLLAISFLIGLGLVIYGVYLATYKHPADYTEGTAKVSTSSPAVVATPTGDELVVDNHIFNLDLADTEPKRAQGLSGRVRLAEDQGMLFIFPRADKYSFWMKDMLFPLDMLWINGDRIVDLTRNAPIPTSGTMDWNLPTYSPSTPADKVLEIDAGLIDRFGIKVGDKVIINFAKN